MTKLATVEIEETAYELHQDDDLFYVVQDGELLGGGMIRFDPETKAKQLHFRSQSDDQFVVQFLPTKPDWDNVLMRIVNHRATVADKANLMDILTDLESLVEPLQDVMDYYDPYEKAQQNFVAARIRLEEAIRELRKAKDQLNYEMSQC